MPLQLYDSRVSGNAYKVRLAFAHLGVAYERIEVDVVDRSGRMELLGKMNPALRVPVLKLEDGRSLAESNAILAYIAEGTPLIPQDMFEYAKVLQWLFFEQYSHEPHIALPIFWLQYATERPSDEAIERRRVAGYAALDGMERHLVYAPYLVDGTFSIADISLYAYTHRAELGGYDLSDYPGVRGWLARVAAQPGHITIED